jgi:hypothetical protein
MISKLVEISRSKGGEASLEFAADVRDAKRKALRCLGPWSGEV